MRSTDTSNVALVERAYLSGALGVKQLIQPNRPVTMILVSVKLGAIDIYIGEAILSRPPDLHFGQSNRPVWVPWFAGQADLTAVCADPLNTTQGSVILGGPRE